MVTVGGTKQYGKIARVPGVLYISTRFVHFCFLPLFPTKSFIVRAGSEVSDGFFGGTFQGKSIPLHVGSVLAGYVRWWLGISMVVMAFATLIAASEFLRAASASETVRLSVVLGCLGLLMLPLALSMAAPGSRGYWFQAGVHLTSAVVGVIYYLTLGQQPHLTELRPAVNTPVPPLVVVNVCLFVCGLFRNLDYATSDEAQELLQELGIEPTPTAGEDWELME